MSKPILRNPRAQSTKTVPRVARPRTIIEELSKPLPQYVATMLAQANLELRISYHAGGGAVASLYQGSTYIGAADQIDRLVGLAKFARSEDRRLIAVAEQQPIRSMVANALGIKTKEKAAAFEPPADLISRVKLAKRTLDIIDANIKLLKSITPTSDSSGIKELSLDHAYRAKDFVCMEVCRYLKADPVKKEDKQRLLQDRGLTKWTFNRFSTKLEKPESGEFNFSRLYFPRNITRGITMLRTEMASSTVRASHAPLLDNAGLVIDLAASDKALMALGLFGPDNMSELPESTQAQIRNMRIHIPPCSVRVLEILTEVPTRKKLDTLPQLRAPTGVDLLTNAFNRLVNIAVVFWDVPDFRLFTQLIIDKAEANYLQTVREAGLPAAVIGLAKDRPEAFKLNDLYANPKETLRILAAASGWTKEHPSYVALIALYTKTVGDKTEKISRLVEKPTLGKLLDSATDIRQPELSDTAISEKLRISMKQSGATRTRILAISALTPRAKAYIKELADSPLKHLTESIGEYLKGFQSNEMIDLAVRRLQAELETFIEGSEDEAELESEPASDEE